MSVCALYVYTFWYFASFTACANIHIINSFLFFLSHFVDFLRKINVFVGYCQTTERKTNEMNYLFVLSFTLTNTIALIVYTQFVNKSKGCAFFLCNIKAACILVETLYSIHHHWNWSKEWFHFARFSFQIHLNFSVLHWKSLTA